MLRPLPPGGPPTIQPLLALGTALAPTDPIEELRHAIDLVVVFSIREGQQLMLKGPQPVGFPGNQDHAALDLGHLDREPRLLVVERLIAREPSKPFIPELLAERVSGLGHLDDDLIRLPLVAQYHWG